MIIWCTFFPVEV